VAAGSPAESLKLAQTLYNNYLDYIDFITKERTVSYYYDNFSAGLESQEILLKSTKEILQKNEATLAGTPQSINQGELNNNGSNMVIENIINPAYSKLSEGIADNKQVINTTEDTIRTYKENLKQLDLERQAILKYNETGEIEKTQSSTINVAKTSIFLVSSPVAPTNKTSPSNSRNAIIGFILGGMLGVGIALMREYWLKKV
jgi:LPS O-antigen subunit length determinant protein (WzzB/FepE family)